MPNWVYNTLTIEGNPDSVNRLKEQMNQPFTRNHDQWNPATGCMEISSVTYDEPIFSFWNIIKPTDLETYDKQPDYSLPMNEMSKGDDWYNWNIRNWGVKWDVGVSNSNSYKETNLFEQESNGDNSVLVYRFDTPWGIPIQALENLSSQYPDLLLTLVYEEETGWGGECEFIRGKHIEGSEYNWKCWECDYEETGEPPYCETCEYDMCPSCGNGEPRDEDRANCEVHKK